MTIPFQLSTGLADVAGKVRESVVQIQVGDRGIGSGVIWQQDAPGTAANTSATVIVTNAHVVHAARQDTFNVKLPNGKSVPASLWGSDPSIDLAALVLPSSSSGEPLHAAEIGDSAALRVGELVIAVGNPFGREGAVTLGVVAARAPADEDISLEPAETEQQTNRDRSGARFRGIEVIQADIRLYPGNSGGPLADARGRVVGVNAMVGGGLGFAIPSRIVRQFLEDLKTRGEPAYLGIEVLTVPLAASLRTRHKLEQETAALVTAVAPNSPAEAAGLLPGDVLLRLDEHSIREARTLPRLLGSGDASVRARRLTILRGGEPLQVELTPALRKAA
jgi:serine protease Do